MLSVDALYDFFGIHYDAFSVGQEDLYHLRRFFLNHTEKFTAVLQFEPGLLKSLYDVSIRFENRLDDVFEILTFVDSN